MKRFVITAIAAAVSAAFSVSAQTSKAPSTGPENAAPGECYARVVTPARFETRSEQVLSAPAGKRASVIPAKMGVTEETEVPV